MTTDRIDREVESLLAAARGRAPIDPAALDRAQRRARATLRASARRRRRAIALAPLAALCIAGGALAAATTHAVLDREEAPAPITFDDGEVELRTSASRAVVKTPDLVLTVPPKAEVAISVRDRRTERIASRRGSVRIESEDEAPIEIDPGAEWTPERGVVLERAPPEPPRALRRGVRDYVPRGVRELERELE